MSGPPSVLDGARVLCWAASHRGGFYQLAGPDPPITVAAMAVARYSEGGPFYLFKCDASWDVVQDWDCESVAEAKALAAQHANGEILSWQGGAFYEPAEVKPPLTEKPSE
jgi:hypothetical protein